MRAACRLSPRWRLCAPLAALGALCALALLAGACGGGEATPTINVAAASSLRHVLPRIAEDFERSNPGVAVELRFAGSQVLASQIEEGADDDVFISANLLQAARLLDGGFAERPTLVTGNVLVLAVAEDAPWRTVSDLALADVRIAAAAPSAPVGALTAVALGLLPPETADALRRKIATEDPSVRIVLSRLELDEVDAAFVYASDVVATDGLRAIALPPETPANAYVAVLVEDGDAAAEGLIGWLLSVRAQAIFQLYGFLPSTVGVQAR